MRLAPVLVFVLTILAAPCAAQQAPPPQPPVRVSGDTLHLNRTPTMAARDWIWRGAEVHAPVLAGRLLEVEIACAAAYGPPRCHALSVADLPLDSESRAIVALNRYLDLWVVQTDEATGVLLRPGGPGVVTTVSLLADALLPVPAEQREAERMVSMEQVQLGTLTSRIDYPRRALRDEVEGTVWLDCRIHTDLSAACVTLFSNPRQIEPTFAQPLETALLRGRVGSRLRDGTRAAGARFTLALVFRLPE